MTVQDAPREPNEKADPTKTLATAGVGAACVLVAAVSFAVGTRAFAQGAAIGAGLALFNWLALARLSKGIVDERPSARGLAVGGMVFKFVLVLALFWGILRHGWAQPLPLVIGYLALPLGSVVGSLLAGWVAREDSGSKDR